MISKFMIGSLLLININNVLGAETLRSNPNDVVARAEEILELHANKCDSGNTGWWLDLFVGRAADADSGGIFPTSGKYHGCGTCEQCRQKVMAVVQRMVESIKGRCTKTGAVVTSVTVEEVRQYIYPSRIDWWFSQSALVDCKRWVPCY